MAYKLGFKRVGSLLTAEKATDGKEHRLARFVPFIRGEGTETKEDLQKGLGALYDAWAKFDQSKKGRKETNGKVEPADVDYASFGNTSPATPERFLAALWRGLSLDHTPEMQAALAQFHKGRGEKKASAGRAENFVE